LPNPSQINAIARECSEPIGVQINGLRYRIVPWEIG
jgi:hypothetical protein